MMDIEVRFAAHRARRGGDCRVRSTSQFPSV